MRSGLLHSVTLIGTAYGIAPVGKRFQLFVEPAVAVSIVYMALENIVGASRQRCCIIPGIFGLVHAFGIADTLKEQLQFVGSPAKANPLVEIRRAR